MTSSALGIIEVIGFTSAVEAADSALKAANVSLLGIAKVSGGIVDVQLIGDIGAIEAACQASAAAAERIGTLRSVHVIPRMHPDVEQLVLNSAMHKKQIIDTAPLLPKEEEANVTLSKQDEEESPVSLSIPVEIITPEVMDESVAEETILEIENQPAKEFAQPYTRKKLSTLNNKELKKMIMDSSSLTQSALKNAKKDRLIQILMSNGKEEDD